MMVLSGRLPAGIGPFYCTGDVVRRILEATAMMFLGRPAKRLHAKESRFSPCSESLKRKNAAVSVVARVTDEVVWLYLMVREPERMSDSGVQDGEHEKFTNIIYLIILAVFA
jgi:hypothetical protein